MKIQDLKLVSEEMKIVNGNVLLYFHTDYKFNINIQFGLSSKDMLLANPITFVDVENINGNVVFVYKKMGEGPLRKLQLDKELVAGRIITN